MDKTFYLEIITPEKQFYVGPASSLVMPAWTASTASSPATSPSSRLSSRA